ncbi:MAG: aminoglycoside phosphotransferase family protein [Thermomicrobiales bacterium]|nr:aminoglycoside phosphotransferase family protein [Thermomicrobiales bacterium]
MTKPEFEEDRWRALWERYDPSRRFISARPLDGGISAEVVVIEYIAHHGLLCRVLARRHGPADLARNPRVAWDERDVLAHLREYDFPAPTVAGWPGVVRSRIFRTPVLFIEFLEGTTTPIGDDHSVQAGALLGRLHQLPVHPRLWKLRRIAPDALYVAPRIDSPLALRIATAANELLPSLPARFDSVLLHGDFWPGNLLWNEHGQVKAIDWEDAAIGAPAFDFANARLEWRLAYGAVEALMLTAGYVREHPSAAPRPHPWFDLFAAHRLERKLSSFGLEPDEEQRWRTELATFVDEAIAMAADSQRA